MTAVTFQRVQNFIEKTCHITVVKSSMYKPHKNFGNLAILSLVFIVIDSQPIIEKPFNEIGFNLENNCNLSNKRL